MKLSNIFAAGQVTPGKVLNEVNRIYMENREEFETTTVCRREGKVEYIHGEAPKPPEYEDGEEIEPGVIWHTLASWNTRK